MTPDTYPALVDCARRRFSEWELSRRELRVVELVLEMSFSLAQVWACIPKLQLLGDACGLDRADASRTVRRLVTKGALMKQEHAGETLYSLALFCKTVPLRTARAPVHSPEVAEVAREKLRELQRRRLNGSADFTGQIRLPGRVVSEVAEDAAAPEMALRALLEQGRGGSEKGEVKSEKGGMESTRALEPESVRSDLAAAEPLCENGPEAGGIRTVLDASMADDEFTRLLEMEARKAVAEDAETRRRGDGENRNADALLVEEEDQRVESCRRGLSEEQGFLFDRLREEFSRGGKRADANFRQYAPFWRKLVVQDGYAMREAIADHKLKKGGPADKPGAWMLHRYQAHARGSEKGKVKSEKL